ncbi:MAG TPA: hypothetical protein VFR37_02565 [Longimicrobium sp.]|nr:hypothetical protein [Longimicrobium sp.]
MRKTRLSLDDLAVETFAPDDRPGRRGTVAAHQSGLFTDECISCGVHTGCTGGCETEVQCATQQLCPSHTCFGHWTCEGVNTCAGGTCEYPECTNPGAGC